MVALASQQRAQFQARVEDIAARRDTLVTSQAHECREFQLRIEAKVASRGTPRWSCSRNWMASHPVELLGARVVVFVSNIEGLAALVDGVRAAVKSAPGVEPLRVQGRVAAIELAARGGVGLDASDDPAHGNADADEDSSSGASVVDHGVGSSEARLERRQQRMLEHLAAELPSCVERCVAGIPPPPRC